MIMKERARVSEWTGKQRDERIVRGDETGE